MDNGKERNTEPEKKRTLQAQPSEEKERWCTVRLFGMNSLKEGAMWRIYAMWELLRHSGLWARRLCNNKGSDIFSVPCRATLSLLLGSASVNTLGSRNSTNDHEMCVFRLPRLYNKNRELLNSELVLESWVELSWVELSWVELSWVEEFEWWRNNSGRSTWTSKQAVSLRSQCYRVRESELSVSQSVLSSQCEAAVGGRRPERVIWRFYERDSQW
jgi:hypothetical protein